MSKKKKKSDCTEQIAADLWQKDRIMLDPKHTSNLQYENVTFDPGSRHFIKLYKITPFMRR